MPIRINLLAEAQAAEDQRRKDPVKFAIMGAIFLVALMLGWVGLLQFQIMGKNKALAALNETAAKMGPEFRVVITNRARFNDATKKVQDLERYTYDRMTWANALNALQQCMTNAVENVQILRLRTEQQYVITPPTKVGNAMKPGSALEKVKLYLDAKSFGKSGDDCYNSYNKFREALAEFAYFKTNLVAGKGIRLENLAPPQTDPVDPTRMFVLFTLECQYPDRVR
jgi:hypothetical protein